MELWTGALGLIDGFTRESARVDNSVCLQRLRIMKLLINLLIRELVIQE